MRIGVYYRSSWLPHFFRSGPVFPIDHLLVFPSNRAIFYYSIIGILTGLASIFVTKSVFWFERLFGKIPVHWLWYPAIGGLFAGLVGFFSPHTLGVGYDNITDILSGKMAISAVLLLCFFKFLSWSALLGSGTSGGTLAPLMTIGGGFGAGLGYLLLHLFPDSGITLSLSALVGMMALFAGASRALLTSIIFGVEATGQFNSLLPLFAGCSTSFLVSFFLMRNTIMTEKIAKHGIVTPDSYQSDILEEVMVGRIMHDNTLVVNDQSTIRDIRETLNTNQHLIQDFFIVADSHGLFKGILSTKSLYGSSESENTPLYKSRLISKRTIYTYEQEDLREALEIMMEEKLQVLPVLTHATHQIKGIITWPDIMEVYKKSLEDDQVPASNSSKGSPAHIMLFHNRKFFNHK